jgi:hypothetical protein
MDYNLLASGLKLLFTRHLIRLPSLVGMLVSRTGDGTPRG